MEDLLAHGLPVDVPHPLRHTTALMEATRLGRTTLVSWLLSRGAAPAFLCGLPTGTPLHCALKRHQWEIASLLTAATHDAGVADSYRHTPLHTLAMDLPETADGNQQALALALQFIQKGCPIDATDHEGITALHYCIINDYAALAQLLLEQGANPNTLTPDTHVTPLAIAALEKNATLAQLLIQYGADPNTPTKDGSTPYTIMPSLRRMHIHRDTDVMASAPAGDAAKPNPRRILN